MRVKEWQGEVVFLHEVVPGAADRSYGIQVAKLAGLPPSVIERAKVVLASWKPTTARRRAASRICRCSPPLRGPPAPDPRQAALEALLAMLHSVHPDDSRLSRRSRRCTRSSNVLPANISRRHRTLALC